MIRTTPSLPPAPYRPQAFYYFSYWFTAAAYLQHFLDFRYPSGAADQYHVVYAALVHLGVGQRLLDRLQRGSEQVHAHLLEPSTRDLPATKTRGKHKKSNSLD